MTRLATAGTSSCAVMSIAHFKNEDEYLGAKNNIDWNEEYKKTGKGVTVDKDVIWFSEKVLNPLRQPLDHTEEMPFEQLMEEIERELPDKTIFCTLNESQFYIKGSYWPKELKRWGFKHMFNSDNSWGEMNYIFVRNFIPLDK